mmetsp:Transcript_8660/g.23809  ORF Transcript_8660/g.23809 Transcript_8660/m.23809 type:complete len:300 (+) Transcript_8660:326-1225(+)
MVHTGARAAIGLRSLALVLDSRAHPPHCFLARRSGMVELPLNQRAGGQPYGAALWHAEVHELVAVDQGRHVPRVLQSLLHNGMRDSCVCGDEGSGHLVVAPHAHLVRHGLGAQRREARDEVELEAGAPVLPRAPDGEAHFPPRGQQGGVAEGQARLGGALRHSLGEAAHVARVRVHLEDGRHVVRGHALEPVPHDELCQGFEFGHRRLSPLHPRGLRAGRGHRRVPERREDGGEPEASPFTLVLVHLAHLLAQAVHGSVLAGEGRAALRGHLRGRISPVSDEALPLAEERVEDLEGARG